MSQPYGSPPPNPDGRHLPPGWIQQWDSNYNAWYYVNTQEQPPKSSWVHPLGPLPPAGPPPGQYGHPSGPPASRDYNQPPPGGYNPTYGPGGGGGYGALPPGGYNNPPPQGGWGGPGGNYQQPPQGYQGAPPQGQGSRGLFGSSNAPPPPPQKSGMGMGKMLALGGAAFLGAEFLGHELKEHDKKEREEGFDQGYEQAEYNDRGDFGGDW